MNSTSVQDLRDKFFELIQSDGGVVDMIQSMSAEGVWFWETSDPSKIWINDTFWKTLEYPCDEIGDWKDVIHLDDLTKASSMLSLVGKPENQWSYFTTLRFIGHKGNTFHLRFRVMEVKKGDYSTVLATLADVTELLHAQEVQRKSNEVSKIGFWEVDLVYGTDPLWSKITNEIHEVPPGYTPKLDTAINFYKEGEHRDKITELFNRAVEKGVPFDEEFIIVTHKGNEKWVRSIGTPEFLDGKCVRVYGTFQDIQEKKEQTEELQNQKNFLDDIIENLQEGFILVDSNAKITRVNEAFQEITGYSEEELFAQEYPYDFVVEGRDVDLKSFSAELFQRKDKPTFETKFKKKDGTIVPIRVSPSVLLNPSGELIGLYSTLKDISQEIADKQKIKDSLSKLQSISSATTQVSIIGTDSDGKITSFNTGAVNLLGYEASDMIGERIVSIHLNSEISTTEGIDPDYTPFKELTVLDSEGKHATKEWKYVRKDGSVFPVQLSITPLIDDAGDQIGFLFMGSDISNIKRVKQEIQALLGVTKDQNERLLNFAHIVSHNLRSHSSNFRMILDLMTMDSPQLMQDELFEKLMEASDNLKETIAHLNEVVIMNTSTEENLKNLSVFESLERALKNVEGYAKENEVEIHTEVPKDLAVYGIAAYLDSVILNLISNAIKYSSPSRKSNIWVKAKKVDYGVEISVSDNGVGIDLVRHGSKIFGMYKTFHGNKDARGVGLFITKNQVEAMGGKISVKSEPNIGSTFKVLLNG
ncbi:MAG: PAS domain-containing protein [Schleiferiaceae bacterium]